VGPLTVAYATWVRQVLLGVLRAPCKPPVNGCYAWRYGKGTGIGRVVGSDRASLAPRTAETEGRQTSHRRQGRAGRHHLRPQERHPLGDAPEGDGLRVGQHVLAEVARLGREAGVWRQLHRVLLDRLGDADRIDWSRASLDSASVPAKRGAKGSARTRRIAANRARSATLFRTEGAYRLR
jgi:hypothetical protein